MEIKLAVASGLAARALLTAEVAAFEDRPRLLDEEDPLSREGREVKYLHEQGERHLRATDWSWPDLLI